MNTSTPSEPKLSHERHSDDVVDRRSLLFRLHNSKTQATLFDAERTILLASRHAPKSNDYSEELNPLLESLEKTPSPTLDEASVAKHVASWKEGSKEPSEFISLTSNVLWVLWEWKRRMFNQSIYRPGLPDDFFLIILESSELRGRSKPVTKILNPENYRDAYNFAHSADEVVVADIIRKGAILGTTPMSRLLDFVPPWWKEQLEAFDKILRSENEAPGQSDKSFKSFRSKLKPPTAADDCARHSLRFAMALLAPLLVPNLQRRADIVRVVDSTGRTIDGPQAAEVNTKVDLSGNNTSLRKRKAEEGYVSHSVLSLDTNNLS